MESKHISEVKVGDRVSVRSTGGFVRFATVTGLTNTRIYTGTGAGRQTWRRMDGAKPGVGHHGYIAISTQRDEDEHLVQSTDWMVRNIQSIASRVYPPSMTDAQRHAILALRDAIKQFEEAIR